MVGRVAVIDEIQHRPDLFQVLRVLADRKPLRARFLILGSASPSLLRQSSESLAGRIEIIPVGGQSRRSWRVVIKSPLAARRISLIVFGANE